VALPKNRLLHSNPSARRSAAQEPTFAAGLLVRRVLPYGRAVSLQKVHTEAAQAHNIRKPLYKQLSAATKCRVIAFYTAFSGNTIIDTPDAEMVEEVIAQTKGKKAIALVVNSPGGNGVEAERIVRVCRKRSGDDFQVIVPRMAKSAATLICMGADKIIMSSTTELGPIDPQVPWRTIAGFRLFPTRTLVEIYDTLLADAQKTTGNVEPFLQQLQLFNAGEVAQWRKFEALTVELATKLLAQHQMKGKKRDEIMKKIKIFTESGLTLDHGRPIFAEIAKRAGLLVQTERTNSALWSKVWELHARCSHVFQQGVQKLIESEHYQLLGS